MPASSALRKRQEWQAARRMTGVNGGKKQQGGEKVLQEKETGEQRKEAGSGRMEVSRGEENSGLGEKEDNVLYIV